MFNTPQGSVLMLFSGWQFRSRIVWLIAVCVLVSLDQLTKTYFANTIPLGGAIPVTEWFNLVHLLNEGAAFSFLADADGWQRPFLITVSLLVVIPVTVVCLSKHIDALDRWIGGAVVAGGTGNLIDRIQTGAVVDFLDVHWHRLHWPAFNLADIYIVLAAITWVLLSLKPATRRTANVHKPKIER
jgi:signal peptidase II